MRKKIKLLMKRRMKVAKEMKMLQLKVRKKRKVIRKKINQKMKRKMMKIKTSQWIIQVQQLNKVIQLMHYMMDPANQD